MPLWMSTCGSVGFCRARGCPDGGDESVDFACDITFQAPDDLPAGFALREASPQVVLGPVVPAQAAEDDPGEGRVGLAVTATVETASLGLAGGCLDGAGAAQGAVALCGVGDIVCEMPTRGLRGADSVDGERIQQLLRRELCSVHRKRPPPPVPAPPDRGRRPGDRLQPCRCHRRKGDPRVLLVFLTAAQFADSCAELALQSPAEVFGVVYSPLRRDHGRREVRGGGIEEISADP